MASRINWKGKTANMITVGKSNWTDYRTIGSALDSITDAAADNRYVIMLAHDRTTEQVSWNTSHVDLAGESRWWSIVERPGTLGGFAVTTGGTIQVATDVDELVEDCGFYGFRVVRNIAGGAFGGAPPEAGFFLGDESKHPLTVHWNNITISGCVIEGVHDGFQCFGQRHDFAGLPSRVHLQGNQIRSCHDAVTVKGLVRLTEVGDMIEVRSQGFAPYLDAVEDWKHTGLHVNMGFGQVAGAPADTPATAYVHLNGCSITVGDGTNLDESAAGQSVMAGVYLYDATVDFSAAGAFQWAMPVKVSDCSIKVESNITDVYQIGCGGVVVLQQDDASGSSIAAGRVVVSNSSIAVDQLHASGPAAVAGVWLHGADNATADNTISVVGCSIRGSNANGTAYCLQADNQSDTIVAKVYSDLATNIDAAATLTAATVKP